MLAYESVDKCKEDLLKFQLIIQSVAIVTNPTEHPTSASGSNKSTTTTTSKNPSHKKTLPQTTTNIFEEVLDCKNCTLQNL